MYMHSHFSVLMKVIWKLKVENYQSYSEYMNFLLLLFPLSQK